MNEEIVFKWDREWGREWDRESVRSVFEKMGN